MNKKKLYESIMKDVSKIVKKHLNENIDEPMTLADMVQQGIDDGTLEFIGTANNIPVIDLDAAYDYIEDNFPESYDFSNGDYGGLDDLYDDLTDLQTPEFCVYDADVLLQLADGSDGLDDEFDSDNYVVY